MTYRVLVLGGYGHFGARIVRALSSNKAIELVVAGRNPSHGRTVLADVRGSLAFCELDTASPDFASQLLAQHVDTVIHTAGPFQGQGYGVARVCLEAGMNYIDLADGRAFVRDFPAVLNDLALSKQCLAVTGASTLPALSSAVVDKLASKLDRLDEIQIVIAPAQRTPLGRATVEAVLSYCGSSFFWWTEGTWQRVVGWQKTKPVCFARLNQRLAAPCDVPDHDLLVARYPGIKTVQFRAALELGALQWGMRMFGALRACGLPLPIAKLSGFFSRAVRWLDRWGSELGGMSVELRGLKDGKPYEVRWDLTAPHLHGPEIPCMAAILLAQALAENAPAKVGAHACVGLLALEDFEKQFAHWGMTTEVSERLL